jgi:acyl carrier protein
VAAVWREVLELPEVPVDANFADLGGHSLAMVRVLGKLKKRFDGAVTLVDLFRHTTVRSLARHLATAGGDGGAADAGLGASASRAASRRVAQEQAALRRQRPR